MVERAYYSATIEDFVTASPSDVLGRLTAASEFAVDLSQRDAWQQETELLQTVLRPHVGQGRIFLEFVVPRLGKRIDAVLLFPQAIVVVEFIICGAKRCGALLSILILIVAVIVIIWR